MPAIAIAASLTVRAPWLPPITSSVLRCGSSARDAAAEARDAGLADELADDPSAAAVALAGKITRQSWRALELTKLALRSHRPATTTFDLAAQALLFGSQDKYDRMTAFLDRRTRKD